MTFQQNILVLKKKPCTSVLYYPNHISFVAWVRLSAVMDVTFFGDGVNLPPPPPHPHQLESQAQIFAQTVGVLCPCSYCTRVYTTLLYYVRVYIQ